MLVHSYHEIAGPDVRRLPLPYILAESISTTLNRNANDELELIQALDEYGRAYLLIHITSNDQRRLNLRNSEIKEPELKYRVLSPIVFRGHNAKRDLQKKMEKLAKQGKTREDEEDGHFRCLYEYGRLYKRIVFDGITCTELKIPASSIPILSSTKVVAFSFTPWDSDWSKNARDTILDLGIAYARVSHGERALTPAREDTIRINNRQNINLKLRHRPAVDYPCNPSQVETLESSAIGERLKECFGQSVAENPVILLLNDEDRTRDVLNTVFGIDVRELGWKRGLQELFAFGASESSSNRQNQRSRSRSPSRSSYRERERDYIHSHHHPQRRPNQIYMVDIKGIYERLLKTNLKPRDESLNTRIMAMKMGLSISGGGDFDGGKGGWSAGLDAEILIEIFNKMINGTSIDEEHGVLQTLPPPTLASQATASVGGSNDTGVGEDCSDEERDPNDIQQRPLGDNGGMNEDDFSDYGDSDEEY